MKFDAENLARPHLAEVRPYKPGMTADELARTRGIKPERVIKLASNENPGGMSPLAAAAAKRAIHNVHTYPDAYNLAAALAEHWQVESNNIVLGNGSTDVLDLVARAFLGEGREAISSQYGFSMYTTVTQAAGAMNVVVAAKDFGHDLGRFLAAITPRTKVIWIANPNNPTGTFVPYKELGRFLRRVPRHVLVVLDEAYYEYLRPADAAKSHSWVRRHPNLLIVRTFSKIYGLAGLRVGYGIGHPSVVAALQKVGQPCNVNSIGLAAAVAALKDQSYAAASAERNRAGVEQLQRGFDQLGLSYLPAYGNFVTVTFRNAAAVHEQLLDAGIIVRPLAGYGLANYLRISVGKHQDNEKLLRAIRQLCHDGSAQATL